MSRQTTAYQWSHPNTGTSWQKKWLRAAFAVALGQARWLGRGAARAYCAANLLLLVLVVSALWTGLRGGQGGGATNGRAPAAA